MIKNILLILIIIAVIFIITTLVFALFVFIAGFVAKLLIRTSLGGNYNYFNEDILSDRLVIDDEGNIWQRIRIADFDDEDTGQLVLLRTRQEEADRLARLAANQEDNEYRDSLLNIVDDATRLEQALSYTNIDLFHMIIGLVTVSIMGFLQFIFNIAYVGPIPLFGSMHTSHSRQ